MARMNGRARAIWMLTAALTVTALPCPPAAGQSAKAVSKAELAERVAALQAGLSELAALIDRLDDVEAPTEPDPAPVLAFEPAGLVALGNADGEAVVWAPGGSVTVKVTRGPPGGSVVVWAWSAALQRDTAVMAGAIDAGGEGAVTFAGPDGIGGLFRLLVDVVDADGVAVAPRAKSYFSIPPPEAPDPPEVPAVDANEPEAPLPGGVRWDALPVVGPQRLGSGDVLRDVVVDAAGAESGIKVLPGSRGVTIERVLIRGFRLHGIDIDHAGGHADIAVRDVRIVGERGVLGPHDKQAGVYARGVAGLELERVAMFDIGFRADGRRSWLNQGGYLFDCTGVRGADLHFDGISHAGLKLSSSGPRNFDDAVFERVTGVGCGMLANFSKSTFGGIPARGGQTDVTLRDFAGEAFGGEYFAGPNPDAFVLWLPGGDASCEVEGVTCGPTYVPGAVPAGRGIVDDAGPVRVSGVVDRGWGDPAAASLWTDYAAVRRALLTYVEWPAVWPSRAELRGAR